MMKNIATLIVTFFLITSTQAQTAKEWLDKVSQSYKDKTSYYIKFDFEMKNGNQVQQQKTGEVFAINEKFYLNVDDINQIYNGKKLITISKEDKEVTISTPNKDSQEFLTPTKVLSMYKTGYTYSLGETKTIGGKKVQYIKLTPTDNKDIQYALVGIYANSSLLYQYQEISKNKNTLILTVKENLENLIIPKELFNFDAKKYKSDGYFITEI